MFHGSDWRCQEGSGYPSQEEPRCRCWEVTGFFLQKFTLIRRLSHPQLLSFMQTIFLWTWFPDITLTAGWPSPVLLESLMQHRYCALKEKTLFLWSLNIKTLLGCDGDKSLQKKTAQSPSDILRWFFCYLYCSNPYPNHSIWLLPSYLIRNKH